MRTLFSGEELNRFMHNRKDFVLPNGDSFFADGYYSEEMWGLFLPELIYDLKGIIVQFESGETQIFSFTECFYAWACQVAKDIPLTDSNYLTQPEPVKNDLPAVWDLVIQDMQNRDKVGQERYGTRLQPHNGRDVLVDAYSEALDLSVYLRQAIFERDGK